MALVRTKSILYRARDRSVIASTRFAREQLIDDIVRHARQWSTYSDHDDAILHTRTYFIFRKSMTNQAAERRHAQMPILRASLLLARIRENIHCCVSKRAGRCGEASWP